jgi:hypothetical protein
MKKPPRLHFLKPRLATLDIRKVRAPLKTADPFYSTAEHIRWRDEVRARAGGQCETPGCGRRERRMFADHIIELKDGGAPFDLANGQLQCGSCHTTKTAAARAARGQTRL